jgi:hypothetical protein
MTKKALYFRSPTNEEEVYVWGQHTADRHRLTILHARLDDNGWFHAYWYRTCVPAPGSVCVCWIVGACRSSCPLYLLSELESRPSQGGLAQTVSVDPGAARRPPGGLPAGHKADDVPTTNRLATDSAHLVTTHLTSYVWMGLPIYGLMVEKDEVTLAL